jgi:hypothetical protein
MSEPPYGRPVMPVAQRHTFIVQVHPEGLATLENLATRERVQVHELASVGAQIERWLRAPAAAEQPRSGSPGDETESEERR